jgi:heme exporter protein D
LKNTSFLLLDLRCWPRLNPAQILVHTKFKADPSMEKLTEVLAMGGYGGFIWPAFGVTAVVMAATAWVSVSALRRAKTALGALQQGRSSDET